MKQYVMLRPEQKVQVTNTSVVSPAPVEIQEPQMLEPELVPQEPQQEPQKPKINDNNAIAYFTYPNANLFKKLYEAMCVLPAEIIWKFTADALILRQMDPSRVAMIDLTIKKEEFEEFDVKNPGFVSFTNEEVKKVVFTKAFKKDASIGVKIDGVIGRITFVIKDNRTRERSFSTLETEEDETPTPKIVFNAKYKVLAKQVAEDIDDLYKINDHVTITATADFLKLSAEGDCGKGATTYNRGDDTLIDIDVKEESKAVYSLSYLKNFIQPALCDLAILELTTDMPLKVTLLTKFGEIKFYIAPRIETE